MNGKSSEYMRLTFYLSSTQHPFTGAYGKYKIHLAYAMGGEKEGGDKNLGKIFQNRMISMTR